MRKLARLVPVWYPVSMLYIWLRVVVVACRSRRSREASVWSILLLWSVSPQLGVSEVELSEPIPLLPVLCFDPMERPISVDLECVWLFPVLTSELDAVRTSPSFVTD